MIVVVQPAIPTYRYDFFVRLYDHYDGSFVVYAPASRDLGVLTDKEIPESWGKTVGRIQPIAFGLSWHLGTRHIRFTAEDILVISGAPRTLSNLYLMVLARVRKARIVWWGHYLSPTSTPWRHSIRVALMNGANALLFYTAREIKYYRRTVAGQRDSRPIAALNNGLDTRTPSSLRVKYEAANRENSALFIGRLTPKARLSDAIRALTETCGSRLQLHVIGDGPEKQGLVELANGLGLKGRVHWHGGTSSEEAIAAVANRCRFLLYPGDVGLSLIHAFCYGLPVVLHDSKVMHMPEIAAFEEGMNGVSFRRGEVDKLAEVIDRTSQDLELLNRLARGAIQTISTEFNTARMAERFIELINSLRPL